MVISVGSFPITISLLFSALISMAKKLTRDLVQSLCQIMKLAYSAGNQINVICEAKVGHNNNAIDFDAFLKPLMSSADNFL